jgi:hypothetical protein
VAPNRGVNSTVFLPFLFEEKDHREIHAFVAQGSVTGDVGGTRRYLNGFRSLANFCLDGVFRKIKQIIITSFHTGIGDAVCLGLYGIIIRHEYK